MVNMISNALADDNSLTYSSIICMLRLFNGNRNYTDSNFFIKKTKNTTIFNIF